MSKLYFYTPTTLDEAFIFTMGASVKEGSNPIGEFGTGLKYAIAVTLRLGGKIKIETNEAFYDFYYRAQQVRNTSLDMIYCDKKYADGRNSTMIRLPMTTQYGKTWEPWMVMRELYSNTKDEDGIVWDREELVEKDLHENWTLITVEHDEIYDAWQTRNGYILNTIVPAKYNSLIFEVYQRASSAFFYKGIRVSPTPIISKLTYNMIVKTTRLTEDRTMDTNSYGNSVLYAMANCKDRELLAYFFDAACILDSFESKMPFSSYTLGTGTSEEFAEEAVEAITRNVIFAPAGLKEAVYVYRRDRDPTSVYRRVKITEEENNNFTECISLLKKIGMSPDEYTVYFTDDMSSEQYGASFHKRGIIILNRSMTVGHANWKKQTICTLIEEYIHLRFGVYDCTRGMQEAYNECIYSIATHGMLTQELEPDPLAIL